MKIIKAINVNAICRPNEEGTGFLFETLPAQIEDKFRLWTNVHLWEMEDGSFKYTFDVFIMDKNEAGLINIRSNVIRFQGEEMERDIRWIDGKQSFASISLKGDKGFYLNSDGTFTSNFNDGLHWVPATGDLMIACDKDIANFKKELAEAVEV